MPRAAAVSLRAKAGSSIAHRSPPCPESALRRSQAPANAARPPRRCPAFRRARTRGLRYRARRRRNTSWHRFLRTAMHRGRCSREYRPMDSCDRGRAQRSRRTVRGARRRPRARLPCPARRRRRGCARRNARVRQLQRRRPRTCSTKRWSGYSAVSIGVRSAAVTASNQRPASKPTTSLTRRLSMLLKAASARSIVCSCAAMRDAGDASARDFRARKLRSAASAPGFASHCCAAGRKSVEQRLWRRQVRGDTVTTNDRVFERLQRGDLPDADVAIAVARRGSGVLPGGRDDQQHAAKNRHDRGGRHDRELQQRRSAPVSHARRPTSRSR